MANGAETLKRVFLELGGKSVFMVLDDVPEQAFPMVIAGSMVVFHAGQGCAYPTRLLVPKSKYAMAVAILEKARSEEHTSELQSLMRISYAVFCLKKKKAQK